MFACRLEAMPNCQRERANASCRAWTARSGLRAIISFCATPITASSCLPVRRASRT